MREEINNWLKQSEADLTSGRNCIKSGDYYFAVFAFEQCVEKALKSLCLFKLRELPKGHSIIYLARLCKVPERMLTGIRDLNPEYLSTRYPDIAQGIPAELYDANIAGRHERTASEVFVWVKKQMRE